MPAWLQIALALLGGAATGIVLYDRWLRHKNQITGEIEIEVLSGSIEIPAENPWDPPIIDDSTTDGIVVSATIHNNTAGPIVVQEWLVEGPPLEYGPPHVRGEVIEAGKTGAASTMFVPDWKAWDQRLEAGLTSRAEPTVRVSLIALSRASSKRLRLRSAMHNVTDEVVAHNIQKPSINSDT